MDYVNTSDTKYINISNMKLLSLPLILRFENLQIFSCDGNLLTSIPALPENLKELYCSNNFLEKLPPLNKNLEILYCYKNSLTELPELDKLINLKKIACGYNKLTKLPNLPKNLINLYCHNNKITILPYLPSKLKELSCCNNNLSYLPLLPEKLFFIGCSNNPIYYIINANNSQFIKNNVKKLIKFLTLFYCLKFKKKFNQWLLKSQEKAIKKKYHPSNLISYLDDNSELDQFLENW